MESEDDFYKLENLTDRQLDVLRLIAEGYKNSDIAEKLFISPGTVNKHKTNLIRKINLHSTNELTCFAFAKMSVKKIK